MVSVVVTELGGVGVRHRKRVASLGWTFHLCTDVAAIPVHDMNVYCGWGMP